ncbi:ATP synthase F0 subunit C [Candidatus Poribacteria bacterium]|nr:ATP synthase F0 subunit C [Candidatus Poribacteria bacterium]
MFQTVEQALSFAYPIGLGLAAMGAGIGLGRAVGQSLEAMGRQPEAIGRLQIQMIIGCAFIEALAIYALVSPFVAKAAKLYTGVE